MQNLLHGKQFAGPIDTRQATPDAAADSKSLETVVSDRAAADWEGGAHGGEEEDVSSVPGGSGAAGRNIISLLLRGGLTVRTGPWRADAESEARWGAAAAGAASRAAAAGFSEGVEFDVGEKAYWAVEVGWLVGGGGGGRVGDEDGVRREVLTAVFDAGTVALLGVWRGTEERVL